MATSQPSSYIIPATTTTTIINNGNDTKTLCDIKIICTQRKKKYKSNTYLTFVKSCSLLSSSNEQPSIEILGKTKSSSILLNDCISFEYFDTTKNDYQSYIYIYLESDTISIYFSDEHIDKKPVIIKYLEYIYQKRTEKSKELINQKSLQDLPCLSTTENILHTFDAKLIPYETIITREHHLLGPVRLYFTTTDLYIASRDCNRTDLTTTITNQCPSKTNDILCIPYYTIKHYGNRSNIFLIDLGKSNYGNGEIHMKCFSSSLASTIHLLVSPVIEERPLFQSTVFQDKLLTRKRAEKSKTIHPPVQLNPDPTIQSISSTTKHSTESLPEQTDIKKSRSIFGLFRKLVKKTDIPEQSCTVDNHQNQPKLHFQAFANKYFAFNLDGERHLPDEKSIIPLESQTTNNERLSNQHETTTGMYIDMGTTVPKSVQNRSEEIKNEEIPPKPTTMVDAGVNTVISFSPYVHSAIIVGTSVHLLAEERTYFPIGQRSFTSPACVMQPFKTQLNPASHQRTLPIDSQQSLLLSYGIVTFTNNNNNNSSLINEKHSDSNDSLINHRLNSDLSQISTSRQEQPSNIFSFNNILSSSTNSHIFRTLSHSTNNTCDNISSHIHTSNGNIILFDENLSDQTTNYLLELPSKTFVDNTIETNLIKSSSRSQLTYNEKDTNDSYALVEPLNNVENSSLSSLSIVSNKLSLSPEKSIEYTDILLSLNTGDEQQQQQQEYSSSDENNNDLIEEKNEGSSTLLYTDIDFHQTQRRNRIAQFMTTSKLEEHMPPFVL